MIVTTTWGGAPTTIDLGAGVDLSVRLRFDGPQPGAFHIDRAEATPYRAGDWVADTRLGASVNCFVVRLCPHGNGTHTECVGHILDARVAIADVLRDVLLPAWIVSVPSIARADTADAYDAPNAPTDRVVDRASLHAALADCPPFVTALVVRTLPNDPPKAHANFSGNDPIYLTTDAMRLLRAREIMHLLVDFPSVDREDDGGALPNHRIFWDVAPGCKTADAPSHRTITEMVYVPAAVADGLSAVTIEIPDFELDAAPSRVRAHPVVSLCEQ